MMAMCSMFWAVIMVLDNLNGLLNCLSEALKKNDFSEDRKIIQYFYDELKQTKESLPTDEKLNELQNVEIYLETKYEIFYELGNYFDPFYVELKHKIHEAKVSNLYFFV